MSQGSGLTPWLKANVQAGRILSIGGAAWGLELDDAYDVVPVEQLTSSPYGRAPFDHVWINNALGGHPTDMVRRAFEATRPGGTLILTVPFGASAESATPAPLYPAALRRLLDPMFEVVAI